MGYRKILWYLCFIIFISCKNEPEINPIIDAGLTEITERIARNPTVDSLYFIRAERNYNLAHFDEAITDLKYAIQLDSLNALYYHLLADALLDNNQSFEALNTMKEAARVFPGRIQTLLKLAEYQNILKQYDESIKTTLQVLSVDPLHAEGYLMIGLNYRDLKDTANAILSLQKATTYDDKMADAWLLLAQLNKFKDQVYATRCLTNAYNIDTNSIQTLHAIADFYQDQDPLKAISCYEKIISLDPSYIDAIINAGIVYFSIDSFSKALDHFTIACERDPSNALFYFRRGTVKEAINDLEGAKTDYQIAIRLAPENKHYIQALTQLK